LYCSYLCTFFPLNPSYICQSDRSTFATLGSSGVSILGGIVIAYVYALLFDVFDLSDFLDPIDDALDLEEASPGSIVRWILFDCFVAIEGLDDSSSSSSDPVSLLLDLDTEPSRERLDYESTMILGSNVFGLFFSCFLAVTCK